MNQVLTNLSRKCHQKYLIHEHADYVLTDLPAAKFLKQVAADKMCRVYAS
jgi:hypothetical protein